MTRFDFDSPCRIVCGNQQGDWVVYLPGRLTWSAAGMAELFRICREFLCKPQDAPGDLQIEEAWESFHIVSIQEAEENSYILDVDWQPDEEEPVPSPVGTGSNFGS